MKGNKRFLLVLFALLASNMMLLAQTKRTITGVVNDNKGKPVPSATVSVKGTTESSVTDESGRYSISVNSDNAVLVFSSVSFLQKEISVGSSNSLNVILESSSTDLGEVVVTALGIKREKKSLGYAMQEVKGETIVSAKEPNLANALTGKIAGLQVVRSSDGPAGSSKILLRGNNSLTGSNQPLIIVDGIPIDNFTGAPDNGYWNRSLDMGNGIADINPDDIESLSVLKGPSAAALYGSRAGNGVILITTKSGRKQNGLGITVSSSLGVESIFTNPELQTSFGQGENGIYRKDLPLSWGPKAEGQSVENWDGSTVPLRTYDNVSNFMEKGVTQNYSVSFQQQLKNTSVYTSFNRLEDKGMVPGIKLTRTNITARAISKFGNNDKWTTDTKVQYSNALANNRPIGGRDNSNAFTLYMMPRSIDIRQFSAATNADGMAFWYPGGGNQVNPYWASKYNLNQDSRDRFIMSGSLKYNFTNWLNAEIKAGGDLYTTNTETKLYAGAAGLLSKTGSYSIGKQTFSETNFSTLVTARKDNIFGKLGGMASVGGNLMTSKWSSVGASSGALNVPNLFSVNNGINPPTVSEGISQRKINSLYGNVQVNYDGYLYLDATFRNDWSSTLIKANRSFFYPSLSLSYVFTDMFRNMGSSLPAWISYGKLRASYAAVGNSLNPYELYNTYTIGKDPNGNTTASRKPIKYDPFVKSELIKSIEVGTEMRFVNSRFGFDFSWYKANATNQLLNLPMDPQSGYSSMKVNAGDIQNTGIELMVDGRILSSPTSLNWNLSLNYSNNKNTIEKLTDDVTVYPIPGGSFDDLAVLAITGGQYGEIYGSKFNRVKDAASPYFGQIILDAQGLPTKDPVISKLGNQQAKSLLGVTNTFEYKGIGLSFLIDARFGGQIFSATQVALQSTGNAAVTAPGGERENFVVDGVIADGAGYAKNSIAVSPELYWKRVSTSGNLGINEANLYDASNVRLRNVQLSYDLPLKFLSGTPIQRAKVGVSCNNVWMIKSHVRGIDPESVYATNTNATGFENAGLPTTRTFLFNLSLSF